jgi:hypothetical protein
MLGQSLASAGDADGNGVGDLFIGAPMFNDPDAGKALLHLNPMVTTSVPIGAAAGIRLFAAPNPFGDAIGIGLVLERPTAVGIEIYDARGRLVRSLASARFPAGTHIVPWDGRDDRGSEATGGTFFARCRVAGEIRTTKMVRVR